MVLEFLQEMVVDTKEWRESVILIGLVQVTTRNCLNSDTAEAELKVRAGFEWGYEMRYRREEEVELVELGLASRGTIQVTG